MNMNLTITLFELSLINCFKSGSYIQAKFSLFHLSRNVTGLNADDLIFIREFIDYRVSISEPDLIDTDILYLNSLNKKENESIKNNLNSSENIPIVTDVDIKKEKKILHLDCNLCFWHKKHNGSVCDRCTAYNQFNLIIKKSEKKPGGQPNKTDNCKNLAGLSSSSSLSTKELTT